MKSNLFKRGFFSLVLAQFFGAMNDNILKAVLIFMVINGAWFGVLGDSGPSIVTFCFTVPFILLSGFAGQVSDRYSKRTVTWWVKSVEIPIALIAGYGFYVQNLWMTMFALIALTCQSAFFGPAKYGMIAELVDDSDLSRANGSINMLTNLSVIIGTLLAGVVSDAYCPLPHRDPDLANQEVKNGMDEFALSYDVRTLREGEEKVAILKELGFENATVRPKESREKEGEVLDIAQYREPVANTNEASTPQWQKDKYKLAVSNPFGERSLPMIALVLVAVLGWLASLLLTPLPNGDGQLKFDFNPFSTYIETIKEMSKTRLLMVMMAWGYFYLLAGIALLIVPEYTEIMDITRKNASVLMGVLGIAIGLGCGVAGFISGHRIMPRLIPLGALGLIVFFFLLAFVTPPVLGMKAKYHEVLFSSVSIFIFCAGFSAGFYIVPLQALLQSLSPDGERGRFLGTANGVSFMFLTLASLVVLVLAPAFAGVEYKMFYFCSGLMLAGAIYFLWVFRGTGLLVGSGASGLLLSSDATGAQNTANQTLSEDEGATECLAEDSSLGAGRVVDVEVKEIDEVSDGGGNDDTEEKQEA